MLLGEMEVDAEAPNAYEAIVAGHVLARTNTFDALVRVDEEDGVVSTALVDE